MPIFACRRSSNQLWFSGRGERHMRFVDVAQLISGKLQTDRVNKRRFVKGQLRCEGIVGSPGPATRHRLGSLRTPGPLPFFPAAVAALDARFAYVDSGYNSRHSTLL